MKINLLLSVISFFTFVSCTTENGSTSSSPQLFTQNNKGYELVYNMVQKVGTYRDLVERKNVVYTYTYVTADDKVNVSTEKYIFNQELSYASYDKHERTLPQLEGVIEQGYDGSDYWLKHNGKIVKDDQLIKNVIFSRHTNFYWFTMMQKLLDPGLFYNYIGEKKIDGKDYDVVKITFESTNGKPKDIYQLYINRKTGLVDQFLFTVAAFGKMEPRLMQVEYENIEGILLPTKRRYKLSDWDAKVTNEAWVTANWTDIKFDNSLSKNVFKNK